MKVAVLTVSILPLLFAPCWAKGPIDSFTVGNWAGGAYTDDQTGGFSHCAAYVEYLNGGGSLFASVAKDYSFNIGVSRSTIRFNKGSKIAVKISFDTVGPYILTAYIQNDHFFRVTLPNDKIVTEAFEQANFIYIQTPTETITYKLTSTRQLLPALASCTRSHIAPTVVSKALPPVPAAPTQQPNAEAVAAREKILQDVGIEYSACIKSNMTDIVPYSSEGAETIAQVILTKCEAIQNKFLELTVAIYNSSRSEAEKIVSDAIGERKKSIVADIVTFRAELTKTLMSKPEKTSPETTSSPPGQKL